MNVKQLHEVAQNLYSKRSRVMQLWQETADNFYPERAQFTVDWAIGRNFADQLTTSYPILARRDLGNSLGAMLRPTAKTWFHTSVMDDDKLDNDAREWLEHAEGIQRRAMYDRRSLFTRATKEGDHDFAAFGNCVISVELNSEASGMLYRCWHLRDVAWAEDAEGQVCMIFRKWKPTCRDLCGYFEGMVHTNVTSTMSKDPLAEVNCMQMVVEAEMYDGGEQFGTQYVVIDYDIDHGHEMAVSGSHDPIYVIPRWQTVSGSQYAYSPAVVAALPDARLIQAITATLLEAGEKFTNPPLVVTADVVRGDVAIYAGGLTYVDAEYDERLGQAVRPLTQDRGGMPIGFEMLAHTREMITEAFYLNKLAMPQRAPEMTAYEVGQRVQEYIRQALPIFEPMENDYNGALCERTFEILMRNHAFGDMSLMPKSLRGREVQFRFESPLHDAIERQKGQRLLEAKGLLAQTVDIDPSTASILDAKVALRDALTAVGVPAKWTRSEQEVDAIDAAHKQQLQTQQLLGNMQAGADVAKTISEAQPTELGRGRPAGVAGGGL